MYTIFLRKDDLNLNEGYYYKQVFQIMVELSLEKKEKRNSHEEVIKIKKLMV